MSANQFRGFLAAVVGLLILGAAIWWLASGAASRQRVQACVDQSPFPEAAHVKAACERAERMGRL